MQERRDINVMLEEIKLTGAVIRQNMVDFKAELDEKKALFSAKKYSKIYAVGCGDSLFAGEAARAAFIRDTGIPFEAVEALEFCRYEVDYMPNNSLVFVISYSGSVARTIECAHIARRRGATVVAITGKPQSKLAQSADNLIVYHISSLGFAPGTISFTSPLLLMYLCAIQIGVCNGHLTAEQAAVRRAKLEALAGLAEATVLQNDQKAKSIMLSLKNRDKFYVIGAGPNYPIAHFGAAKFIEGAELDGIPQALEEWAHEQYFVSNEETDTIVIAPFGRSTSRAEELLREMQFIKTGNILITTQGGHRLDAQHTLEIPGEVDEEYSPILTSVAVSLLGYYISWANNKESYNFKSDEQEKEHYQTLHNSRFCEELRDVDECSE